jgi:hypothetical protein
VNFGERVLAFVGEGVRALEQMSISWTVCLLVWTVCVSSVSILAWKVMRFGSDYVYCRVEDDVFC